MDIRKIVSDYRIHMIEEEKSEATIGKYCHNLSGYLEFVQSRSMVVGKESAIEYKAYLKDRYSGKSINAIIAAINFFFMYSGMQDCKVKYLKIQQQTFLSEDRELSKQEYISLVKAASMGGKNRIALMFQTICSTGIRVSEVKYITVEAVRSGVVTVNNKAKQRQILLPDKLRRLLLSYAKSEHIDSGSVFISKNGKPVNRTTIWRWMKSVCGEAMVDPKKVFPHNLRHLFARIFYQIDKDILKLADLLGHSSINTTRIYTMSSGQEHRRILNRMGLVMFSPGW